MPSELAQQPEVVVVDVQPIAAALYPAYEEGLMVGHQFFEARGEPIEPYHFASTVRYAVKRRLVANGFAAEYDVKDLSNNGIRINFDRYTIRCRKIDRRIHDGVTVLAPSPGVSQPMRKFYAQEIQPLLPGMPSAPQSPPELNLMFLWEHANGVLNLYLSCPAGGASRRTVTEYWWRPLDHPATSIAGGEGSGSNGNGSSGLGYEPADEEVYGTGSNG